jgi:cytochrome c-type biogenesis protein CcmH
MENMIAQLEQKVRQNPKDVEAWQNLGWAYMHIRQPDQAVGAYEHAVALAPSDVSDRSALIEARIQSGDGKITDVTVAELRKALAMDPTDPRTRFYLALYKDQQGDHAGAIADWIKLLQSAPADSGWAPQVRRVVTQVAQEQKIDIVGKLPAQESNLSTAPAGPTADQVSAASQMPSGDRSAMIQGMVDKLAEELRQKPHDADGWVRLLRARSVLGQRQQALADYQRARSVFAREPDQLAVLDSSAHTFGVTK